MRTGMKCRMRRSVWYGVRTGVFMLKLPPSALHLVADRQAAEKPVLEALQLRFGRLLGQHLVVTYPLHVAVRRFFQVPCVARFEIDPERSAQLAAQLLAAHQQAHL